MATREMATKQKTGARSSTSKARRPSTGKSRKSAATGSRRRNGTASRSSRARSSSNGTSRLDSARHTVEDTAKGAGQTVGNAASKAKLPLLAGGAALAGAAGGLIVGARQARRHGGVSSALPRRPRIKVSSRDLASAAKEVGGFGTQMGRLASELQHVRETAADDKHRSPVEVVLEGLTARRSRA